MKQIVFFFAIFLICAPAWAASRYFVAGGTGNWNSTTNWAATDGGSSGETAPGVADDVFLTATSGANTMTVNVASSAKSITCTGFTGSLVLGANLTVAGNITLVSGMTFTPSTYKVIHSETGTIKTGGKVFGDLYFTGNAKTHTIDGTVRVDGTISFSESGSSNSYFEGVNTPVLDLRGNASATGTNANATWTLANTIIDIQFNGADQTVTGVSGTCYGTIPGDMTINVSGTLTFANTNIIFQRNITHVAGTVAYGTSNVGYFVYSSAAATITSNSGALKFYDFSLGKNAQVITLVGTMYVERNLLQNAANVGFSASGATNLDVKGNVTTTSNAYGFGYQGNSNVTLRLVGTGNQSFGDANGFYLYGNQSLVINSSGGTVSFGGTTKVGTGTTITYTAGTVDTATGTHTLSIIGNCTLNTDGMDWYKFLVDINGSLTITLTSDLTVTNEFKLWRTAGGYNTYTFNGGTIHLQGDINYYTYDVIDVKGTSVFKIDGSGNQDILGKTDATNYRYGFGVVLDIDKASGTCYLKNKLPIIGGGGLKVTRGTFDATSNTSTVIVGSHAGNMAASFNINTSLYNYTADSNGNTNTVTLTQDLTITGTFLVVRAGYSVHTFNSNTLHLQGDINYGTYDTTTINGTSAIAIDGGATQTLTGNTDTGYLYGFGSNVTFNKSGNAITLVNRIPIIGGTWTYTAGTVTVGTSLIDVKGASNLNMGTLALYNLQISGGTATLTGNLIVSNTTTIDASRTLALGSNTLTLLGNMAATGTLNAGTGKVVLDGAAATQTFSGNNITFYDFEYISAEEKTITFTSGKTYTFSNSVVIIEPYGGSAVTINASTPNTVANWNIDGATQEMERATVADIDASAGDTGHMYKGDITDAQNVNWDASCPVTPVATTTGFVFAC